MVIHYPQEIAKSQFSLLTTTRGGVPSAEFAFFLHNVRDLGDLERRFTLNQEDLARINPNTKTCPVFQARKDAELTRKLYETAPVLVNEVTGENPWCVSFLRMFDMANDSGLFRRYDELEAKGFGLKGNQFIRGIDIWLPLYEAKMIQTYDHRAANVVEDNSLLFRPGQPDIASMEDHLDDEFVVLPRYWVLKEEVVRSLPKDHNISWLFGYKNVTSPTNEHTFLSTILPLVGAGHSIQFIFSSIDLTKRHSLVCSLVANLNTHTFDFVSRQKLGGINFSYFILKQLPVLPPERYTPELLDLIVPKVVELTYTAWDLLPFAQDVLKEVGAGTWNRWFPDNPLVDGKPAPFRWDEDRRATLRAELDAIYAHLYELTGEELDYILETFPIVKRKDVERYGSFRTKEMILERYEVYASIFDKTDGEGGI